MNPDNSVLTVYSPGRSFPSVSVTGTKCDLMCEHCGGSHLNGMIAAETPQDMMRVIDRIISSGGDGLLISGGCDADGSVPVMRMTDAIRYASEKGLKVNIHTGLIGKEDAAALVNAGVKAFSVDVHQDPAIIRNVLHLNVPASAYSDMLDNITDAGGTPVAHLTAGFGTEDLRLSVGLVRNKGLRDVVLLALVPTKGTITEDTLISEDAVTDAAVMMIDTGLNVTLGCMRPRSHRTLEIRCIEAGVRHIANPSRQTIQWAKEKGMRVVEKRTCCCIRSGR
ncbi:MAG: radical SAM protein [Methanomassiliicoccaceae archaeon]|nr:radical SAM protein [Methanomassiliicoccaceae archaeon]